MSSLLIKKLDILFTDKFNGLIIFTRFDFGYLLRQATRFFLWMKLKPCKNERANLYEIIL